MLSQSAIIELLNSQLAIPATDRTLLNYEKWNLISTPRRGAGKGGKWTEYYIEAAAEAAAAWKLIHGKYSPEWIAAGFNGIIPGFSPEIIAIARKLLITSREMDEAMWECSYKARQECPKELSTSEIEGLEIKLMKERMAGPSNVAFDRFDKVNAGTPFDGRPECAHWFLMWMQHVWLDEYRQAIEKIKASE
ncbi:MAG: hypothetical protein GYA36_02060 [Veillonellaceae bacterium]|nr:hypothetical protein [Veillonellaceae bacterium]